MQHDDHPAVVVVARRGPRRGQQGRWDTHPEHLVAHRFGPLRRQGGALGRGAAGVGMADDRDRHLAVRAHHRRDLLQGREEGWVDDRRTRRQARRSGHAHHHRVAAEELDLGPSAPIATPLPVSVCISLLNPPLPLAQPPPTATASVTAATQRISCNTTLEHSHLFPPLLRLSQPRPYATPVAPCMHHTPEISAAIMPGLPALARSAAMSWHSYAPPGRADARPPPPVCRTLANHQALTAVLLHLGA